MIEIEVKGGQAPAALAELIASTLHGAPVDDLSVARTGKLLRQAQEDQEIIRPSHQELETVNFQTIDDDCDWTEV